MQTPRRNNQFTRQELDRLADRLMEKGLINFRQVGRVRAGLPTSVQGRNRTIEELMEMINND